MEFTTHLLRERGFVLTKILPKVDDQNLRRHVGALNKETEGIPALRELADARKLRDIANLTVQGTANCAQMERDRPFSLLALLIPDSPVVFGLARAFQTFSAERRKEVRIFKEIDAALSWLASDEQELLEFVQFVEGH